jgi:rubrerythrin
MRDLHSAILARLALLTREPKTWICPSCGCAVTTTDRAAGYCTQCKTTLPARLERKD